MLVCASVCVLLNSVARYKYSEIDKVFYIPAFRLAGFSRVCARVCLSARVCVCVCAYVKYLSELAFLVYTFHFSRRPYSS